MILVTENRLQLFCLLGLSQNMVAVSNILLYDYVYLCVFLSVCGTSYKVYVLVKCACMYNNSECQLFSQQYQSSAWNRIFAFFLSVYVANVQHW